MIVFPMAFFCALTPLVFDDFGYGAGNSGLAALFSAQVHEHLTWSGKFIGHFMARLLLHAPSWLHPLLSPLIFLGLIFSGVLLTLGINWRSTLRAWQVLLLAGLTWFALPAFGTVFFWRTGTPDYGYSLFFATAFLVPYRFWCDREDYHLPGGLLFALAGMLAGWSNENLGMLVILAALAATLYRFRTSGKVPLWAAAGILGALAGWLLMMTAPANAVRLAQLGGLEKIPVFSAASFHRFLIFWSSQQLELAPYALASLICVWMLHRQGKLSLASIWPGLAFFLMSQASLAAFAFSPSTPYRAMTSTFFYMACCTFSFIVAAHLKNIGAKLVYAAFCLVLLASVLMEATVFVQAQPAIAQRDQDREQERLTAGSFAYPHTDKYFFPTYDIIEINAFPESKRQRMIPWHSAVPLHVEGASPVKGLVISNMVYLDKLPQQKIHVAATAHTQMLASAVQALLRRSAPSGKTASTPDISARYAVASATPTTDGKASLHMPGVGSLRDIAYIGIEEDGKPLVWRRVRQEPEDGEAAAEY